MNLEAIQKQVERDVRIDESHLDSSAANVPILHSKYLQMFSQCQLECLRLQSEYETKYREKYLYYRNDFEVVLKNKAEIDVLMSGDEEMKRLRLRFEYEKTCADYLERVLKQITGLSFLIRDMIEWKKFMAGT